MSTTKGELMFRKLTAASMLAGLAIAAAPMSAYAAENDTFVASDTAYNASLGCNLYFSDISVGGQGSSSTQSDSFIKETTSYSLVTNDSDPSDGTTYTKTVTTSYTVLKDVTDAHLIVGAQFNFYGDDVETYKQLSGPAYTSAVDTGEFTRDFSWASLKAGDTVVLQAQSVETIRPVDVGLPLGQWKTAFNGTMSGGDCLYAVNPQTQTNVDGDNNDIISAPTDTWAQTVYNDSGWVDNKRTITYGAAQHYMFKDGPSYQWGQATVTYTDPGPGTTTTRTVPVYETRTVPVYETRTVPVYETKTVPVYTTKTTTTNPAVTFQVDTYGPVHLAGTYYYGTLLKANKALPLSELTLRNTLDDDNKLGYREDRPLWGATTNKFVTVHAADVTKYGSIAKAISALSGKTPTANVTSAPAGTSVVKAWALDPAATMSAPWGYNLNKPQTDFDDATVAARLKPVTTTTQVQTGTKQVQVQTGTKQVQVQVGTKQETVQTGTKQETVVIPATPVAPTVTYVSPQ